MSYKALYAVLAAVLLFASCSKDNPNSQIDNTPTEGDIMMNVNGYAWAAPQGYITRTGTAVFTMYGQANQTSSIQLIIDPYNRPQSYPLNGITKIMYYDNNIEYQSIRGDITINSEDDYHVAGTFSGELISNSGGASITLTNGSFDISK